MTNQIPQIPPNKTNVEKYGFSTFAIGENRTFMEPVNRLSAAVTMACKRKQCAGMKFRTARLKTGGVMVWRIS